MIRMVNITLGHHATDNGCTHAASVHTRLKWGKAHAAETLANDRVRHGRIGRISDRQSPRLLVAFGALHTNGRCRTRTGLWPALCVRAK